MYQRPACSTFTFTYIRCGYTGHFYRGKWPFYCGNLAWCVWPDFPKINLPWEISMVTSKRRKKPAMTFNVVSSKQGFFRFPRQESQSSFFIWQHETAKKYFVFHFFLAWLREIRDWLNWFVGLDLGTIFPPQRIVLFLACNRTMGCRWTERRNRRSRLKKKLLYIFAKLSGLTNHLKFQLNST